MPYPASLLVPEIEGLEASATLAIHQRSAELASRGQRVYRIGFGQSPFPVPGRIVETLRRHAEEKAYLPVQGLPALCRAVAEHHRREDGVAAEPEHVLVGPGSKELIFLLQLVFRGEVLIPSPSWVSYAPQARILGREPRSVPTSFVEGWKVQPDRLAAACAAGADGPRLLILNSPNNPVGNSYTEEDLAALAEVARRHDVLVLADEIYGRLHHTGDHVSMARVYPEGTILSAGLSKWCGAGGWRLGTFVFPPQLEALQQAMQAVASETFSAVSAPIQYAAVDAFRGGDDIERYLVDSRRVLAALGSWCARTLRQAGVRVHPAQGGFYLFPDFTPFAERLAGRGIRDSTTLCTRLLADTGVATLPGLPFGRPPEELTARLCFVDFDGDQALRESQSVPADEALGEDFLEHCCDNVLRGVERLIDWLDSPAG
ncbi:MAG: aminotransferase class I/II-fold pyridoxal phosphate-dependent enzyme [Acidobacteriota bacterium]